MALLATNYQGEVLQINIPHTGSITHVACNMEYGIFATSTNEVRAFAYNAGWQLGTIDSSLSGSISSINAYTGVFHIVVNKERVVRLLDNLTYKEQYMHQVPFVQSQMLQSILLYCIVHWNIGIGNCLSNKANMHDLQICFVTQGVCIWCFYCRFLCKSCKCTSLSCSILG